MKSQSRVLLDLALLCLLPFALSGCFLAATGSNSRVAVATSPTPAPPPQKAPPQHAKAYGKRAQHHYRYYPDASVYFDTGRDLYFYLDSRGNWQMSVSLPHAISVRLGDHVSISMESDRPYSGYDEHRKQYPPGQAKKGHKKKKWK